MPYSQERRPIQIKTEPGVTELMLERFTGAALEATEQWLAEPSDANRRAAMDAAQKAQGTAAGLASAAAFFSEGSIAPADQPAVAPPVGVTGNLAGGSILVASVAAEPEKVREKYRKALEAGRQIAL